MAVQPVTVTPPAGPVDAVAGGHVADVAAKRRNLDWLGLVPFLAFLALFLLLPTITVFAQALTGENGGVSTDSFREAITGQYQESFVQSIKLSAVTAIIGGVIGVMLAYAVARLRRPAWMRSAVIAFSGVAANLGGIALAFMFFATIGAQGLMTKILKTGGVDLIGHGITVYSFWGIAIVYLYFQIPLMVLVTLPAVDGLKPEWREAASNLGSSSWGYWRRVGIPVLAPSILGGALLLFANAFSAYATAYALSTGKLEAGVGPDPLLPPGQHRDGQGRAGLRAGRVDDPDHGRGHDRLPLVEKEGGAMAANVTEGAPPVAAPAPGAAPSAGRRRRHPGAAIVLILCGIYFFVPLIATGRFAFQRVPMARLGWSTLLDGWSMASLTRAFHDPVFGPSVLLSLKLAVGAILITQLILLPTSLWVHLRIPRARGLMDFLTLLPYVVPPIALVVGVAGAFRDRAPWFLNSDYCLVPFYAVLAMPFTYRALDAGIRAIDLRTLVDASRSLGAGWGTTIGRVLIPNLRAAIIGSSILTATVVLGEFVIASLLLKPTLPIFQYNYYSSEPQGGIALALLLIVATTLLLAIFTAVTRGRRGGGTAGGAPTIEPAAAVI